MPLLGHTIMLMHDIARAGLSGPRMHGLWLRQEVLSGAGLPTADAAT